MSDTCVFCRIFRGEIPAQEVRRTEDVLVFRDTNPHAPTHLLVIPKRHATDLGDFVATASAEEVGDLLKVVAEAGRAETTGGYRVVANEGVDGGQTVHHLHFHVMGGRQMAWPPG